MHILPVDAGDIPSPEPGKDLVAQIVPVDLHGPGLPVPPVTGEDLLGNGLEEPLLRQGRRLVAPESGEQFRRPSAGLVETDAAGVSDGLPETSSLMLAVNEISPGAGGQDPDAEAPQVTVADVVWRSPGLKGLDPALAEADVGHGFPPAFCCRRGKTHLHFRP